MLAAVGDLPDVSGLPVRALAQGRAESPLASVLPGGLDQQPDLENANVGAATVRKAMAIVQSILSFAVAEELIEFTPAAAVRKPATSAPGTRIFLPAEVEQIRSQVSSLRDGTLVSVLAYSGLRPEEVVCRLTWGDIGERAIRYRDTTRHRVRFTPTLAPLADDPREWYLASGRQEESSRCSRPTTTAFGRTTPQLAKPCRAWTPFRCDPRRFGPGSTGTGRQPPTRPPFELRHAPDLRRAALTTIAKQCGTSVAMIEQHYAGVVENWSGIQVPAEDQIRAARQSGGREVDVSSKLRPIASRRNPCKSNESRRPDSNRGPLHYE